MNNEEKILKILETMDNRMESMEGRLESMDSRMESMDNRMESMEGRIESMEGQMESMEGRIESMEGQMESMESGLDEVKNRIIIIEMEHGQKLTALFDGHLQNAEKLDRIEERVAGQEEFVLKRVFSK